jgi:hypothetical protein
MKSFQDRLHARWSGAALCAAFAPLAGAGTAQAQSVPAPSAAPAAVASPAALPAGTQIRFHPDVPLSSADSQSGEHFTFTLVEPLAIGTTTIAAAGARGDGTVVDVAHAGDDGREGVLALRLDSVHAANGGIVALGETRVRLSGKSRKAAAALLGFLPHVGAGAHYIAGEESRIGPDTTVLATIPTAVPLPGTEAALK